MGSYFSQPEPKKEKLTDLIITDLIVTDLKQDEPIVEIEADPKQIQNRNKLLDQLKIENNSLNLKSIRQLDPTKPIFIPIQYINPRNKTNVKHREDKIKIPRSYSSIVKDSK